MNNYNEIPSFYSSLYNIIISQLKQQDKLSLSFKTRILKAESKYSEIDPFPSDPNLEELNKKINNLNNIVENELNLKYQNVFFVVL